MKKTFYGIAAAFAVLALASCGNNSKGSCENGVCDSKCEDDCVKVFTGVLPAADCDGIRYTLSLDFDKENNCTKGDYDLMMTYLSVDSVGNDKDFPSKGDFTVNEKDGKKYYKLVQDMKDSQPGAEAETMYFVLDNDSTITMVNSDLERPAAPGLNYSLTLKK